MHEKMSNQELGYDILTQPTEESGLLENLSLSPNLYYEQHLKLHKVASMTGERLSSIGSEHLIMPGDDFETVKVDGQEYFVTPTDHTGLPYPIASIVRAYRDRARGIIEVDMNHMFPKFEVNNSSSPALVDELGKQALIGLRGEYVDYDEHHGSYNNLFVGPQHPQTRANLVGTLINGWAGHVPQYSLDLSESEPGVIELTNKERMWLWTSGQLRIIDPEKVTRYIKNYILSTEADHIPRVEIEEFLYTSRQERRIELAHLLADKIIERAVEPIEPVYRKVRKISPITFMNLGPYRRSVPDSAQELIKTQLSYGRRIYPLMGALQVRLAQEERRPRSEYAAGLAA